MDGGNDNDTLTGGNGRNRLFGQGGVDTLFAKNKEKDELFATKGDVVQRDSFDVLK